MDDLLREFDQISKAKRLIPAEQVVMSAVLKLDDYLTQDLSPEIISQVHASLLSLFNANNGDFSIQCSLFIATKIVRLYQLSKNPQIWDLISFAISKTCTSTIVATGYVCRKIGKNFKSQLPRFVEHLLKLKSNFDYPVAYSLRGCFKTGGKTLSQYTTQALEFAKRSVSKTRQATTVAIIKLLKVIAYLPGTNIQLILDIVSNMLKEDQIPFIKNEIASLVAKTAFVPLYPTMNKRKKEKSEWSIEKSDENQKSVLDEPLKVLALFPSIYQFSVPHFFNLLTPSMFQTDNKVLYNFVKKNCSDLMNYLVPMLPTTVRYTYFKDVSESELSSHQLNLLKELCPDNESLYEAAGVAFMLASSKKNHTRKNAYSFFANFTKSHPQVTLSYLRSSLVFLAQPPDSSPQMERDVCGNTMIAFTILSNLPRIEDGINPNEAIIQEYIEDALTNSQVTSPRFSGAILLLSVLPEEFSQKNYIEEAITKSIQYFNESQVDKHIYRRLIKAVAAFLAKHLNEEQGIKLISIAFSKNIELPLFAIEAIVRLIPTCCIANPLANSATDFIFHYISSLAPSVEIIKKLVSRPLPTGFDLLKITSTNTPKKQKIQNLLDSIIINFPSLISCCDANNRSTLLETIVQYIASSSVALVIILSLSVSQFQLPPKAYSMLTGYLSSNNLSQLQVVTECIAIHASHKPEVLPTLFAFIEKNSTISSCILLSSLFSHCQLPNNYISRSIIFLNANRRNGSLISFIVHGVSSMLLTHSIQLSNLGITWNQLTELFNTLNTTVSFQPVSLYLCSECFSLLVELLSSEIMSKDSQLAKLVVLTLRTFELTPITYSREAYYTCARAIVTFAHHLHEIAPITFPTSLGVSDSIQLSACAAYSDYLKFGQIEEFEVEEILKHLLILLQKTSDERAASFIVSLASVNKKDDDKIWVQTVHRLMIANSLFRNNPIEPNAAVKMCALSISLALLPKFAQYKKIKTSFLDDLISSACRATESDRIKLQGAAFPVLQKVIELFKDRTSDEGGRLLDLYDSQFSQAVIVGFKLNLKVSGGFLYTYLSFNTECLSSASDNCSNVLRLYLTGLAECKQRTGAYFSLATHLCAVSIKYSNVATMIQNFLESMNPIFFEIVLKAMELRQPKSDWRALSQFRSLASSFYVELLPAFVWLQKSAKSTIDIKVLVSYCILEIKTGKEKWISNAAFNALPVAIEYFSNQLSPELIELAIRTINDYKSGDQSSFTQMLLNSSKILQDGAEYDQLRQILFSLLMSSKFDPKICAYLIRSDKENRLSAFIPLISDRIIDNYLDNIIPHNTAVALFSLLSNHYPEYVGISIQRLINLDYDQYDFILAVLKNALIVSKGALPLERLSRYFIEMFKRGGMQTLGLILINNPDVGIALLSKGNAKAAFVLCSNDLNNAIAFLHFITLSLTVAQKNEMVKTGFSKSCLSLAFKVITTFGNDVQRGPIIVQLCVKMIRICLNVLEDEFKSEYSTLNDKELVIKMLNTHIIKANIRQKSSNLMSFSTTQRKKTYDDEDDDGWQTLEIGDSD